MHTLGEQLSIFIRSILRRLCSPSLQCDTVTLMLDALGGDEALDLWCFGVWLGSFLLGDYLSSNDELAAVFISVYAIVTLIVVAHTEHHLSCRDRRICEFWRHAWGRDALG